MILYCMRWDALQKAKSTLEDVCWHYFADDSSSWMDEEWGAEAFEPFLEVPDFELALPGDYAQNSRGQLDIDNCKKVYNGLRSFLTASEASQERLWAGICNKTFYPYMRERWGYDKKECGKDLEKQATEIIGRFFFRQGRGAFRNTLAKCWWISHLLYDEASQDPYHFLDRIGASSFSTKVTDIFYNYSFPASPTILRGIVLGIEEARRAEIPIDHADVYLRPALKHLNAVGGSVILDTMSPEDIAGILVEGARMAKQQPTGMKEEDDPNDSEEDF